MKSFTLLEVMIAISVLTLAVSGSFILIQQTLVAGSLNQSRLIANYLIQEGFEIVRNIRDSNWLKQSVSWKEGLATGEWEIDYDETTLTLYFDTGRYLYIDGANGFYTYIDLPSPDDIKTTFKRKITINKINEIDEDSLEVKVEVEWEERGRTHPVSAKEYLYNWK